MTLSQRFFDLCYKTPNQELHPMRTAKRRRTRSKKTEIPGKRIDRLPSLLPARMLAMETAETEEIDAVNWADNETATREPYDRFTALDDVVEELLPLPKPVLKPLTQGQRVQLMAWRYERGMRLWHPAEKLKV